MKQFYSILFVFLGAMLSAQITTFQRTYKTPGDEFAGSVVQASNGDFLTVGYTQPVGSNMDALIIRTNSLGQKIWAKTYGDGFDQHFLSIIEDGNTNKFYVVGWTDGQGPNNQDAVFGKIDGNGNVIWMKAYGGTGDEQCRKIIPAGNKGFYIVGHSTSSLGAGLEDSYVFKIDSLGNMLWSKTFGGANYDRARSFAIDHKKNLVLAGFTQSYGAGGKDAYIVKMDTTGNFIWSYAYGTNKTDKLQELVIDSVNNITVAGETNFDLGSGNIFNPFLMKVDSMGNKKWLSIYQDPFDTHCWSLTTSLDGGYIFANEGNPTTSLNDSTTESSIVKTNATGVIAWSYKLGGAGKDKRPEVIKTTDGGYFVTSSSSAFAQDTMRDIYHVKMTALGVSGCNSLVKTFTKVDTNFTRTPVT